ncbi:MAG: ribonuclease E/G, partial [Alphaproteobacteria bacterium]
LCPLWFNQEKVKLCQQAKQANKLVAIIYWRCTKFMSKKLLIDASQSEETRVAVVDGNNLEEFDSENFSKKQLKSNIYLAKVVRIEPSLQAAFVEYGGDKHGFLPFAEIHPDYYRIPVSDRKALQKDLESEVEESTEEETPVAAPKKNYRYKIQEVIQKRQILLVQVVREQRANKGAALTTYISIAGRYCVLMPNSTNRTGGISRKIQDDTDRKRLKEVLTGLDVPEGMNLIVRTAGQERSKLEIRRDYDYLIKVWEEIREKTLQSIAPCLIHDDGDLVKRAIRDIYTREIDEILVEGEEAYKDAKEFMKILVPSHAKKVKLYKDAKTPLFHKFKVEQHIEKMMFPKVELPSGGTIVINHTEALVAIDVNSGRSTKERNIDVTALKTNLEAAQEIGRQLRLRDLAGLLVIDFIDMDDNKYIQQVEQKLKESVKQDRARIQIGRISQFGLLELSRQRLRPSLMENHTSPCSHCHGTGTVRSSESLALQVLRAIEQEAIKGIASEIEAAVPKGTDLYLLNQKRREIIQIENRFDVSISVVRENLATAPFYRIDILKQKEIASIAKKTTPLNVETSDEQTITVEPENKPEVSTESVEPKKGNKKRRRKKGNKPKEPTNENTVAEKSNIEVVERPLPATEQPLSQKYLLRKKIKRTIKKTTNNIPILESKPVESKKETQENAEPPLEEVTTTPIKKRRRNRNRKRKDPQITESSSETNSSEENNEEPKNKKKNWLRRLLD